MNGISFKVDARGAKTAAAIDLRRDGRMWEDFYDTLLTETRTNETGEGLSLFRRRLTSWRKAIGR
jgi:hypothetical protein